MKLSKEQCTSHWKDIFPDTQTSKLCSHISEESVIASLLESLQYYVGNIYALAGDKLSDLVNVSHFHFLWSFADQLLFLFQERTPCTYLSPHCLQYIVSGWELKYNFIEFRGVFPDLL